MSWTSTSALCLLCAYSTLWITCYGSFMVLTPKSVYPGIPLGVSVTAHKVVTAPVSVALSLETVQHERSIGNAETILLPGETKLLTIQVPLLNYTSPFLQLKVSATGGFRDSQTKMISINQNTSLILVQTDKAIYKPGQKVRIRVVNVDRYLKPVFNPLTVIIENAKNDKLEEYKDVNSKNGVVERIFQLSDYPSLGTWKIHVNSGGIRLYTSTFMVEEFVLPKFSVDVKTSPGFLVLSDQTKVLTITVTANYTYGKGVQGQCELTVHYTASSQEIYHKELNSDGVAVFDHLDWKKLSRSVDNITVQAAVTDETGRKEQGETTLAVYADPKRVRILDTSTTILRHGLPAHIYIEVSDHSGNPVSPVTLMMDVTHPELKGFTEVLNVPAGETIVKYTFIAIKSQEQSYYYNRGDGTLKAWLQTNDNVFDSKTFTVYRTKSPLALSILPLESQTIRVGESAIIKVNTSLPSYFDSTLAYLVMSQGNIVSAGQLKDNSFVITPTLEFCPLSRLLVYMIAGSESENGEVVLDAVDLTLTGCFTKEVKVEFEASETRTGTEVEMKVDVSRLDGSNEMPGQHDVFYLAVDQSIVLLQGSTDLNTDKVVSGLSSFDKVDESVTLSSAAAYFEHHKLLYLTDARVWSRKEFVHRKINVPNVFMEKSFVKIEDDFDTEVDGKVPEAAYQTSARIRKDFPDTWLWGQAVTDVNGHLRSKVVLPDTITSWIVSAFAVNSEGLAVAKEPFKLTAFQLFFLSMNLPYSIKRGEVFVLRVTVFNYRSQHVQAVVSLAHSDQFMVVDETESEGWYSKSLSLEAYRASSVSYRINATTLGQITLHVTATDPADGQKDEVKRELLVKPEGVERSRAITKVMILNSGKSLSETFNIKWPQEKIVPDSQRVEIKVTGEVFGQALSGLENLVSIPFGCGEQNMISTVPNIFGLKYIRGTSQGGMEDLAAKLTNNMKLGYQRQVENYRHEDGSYSAWGDKFGNAESGSTWLTAFVIRSFAQASKFISVDNNVLETGIEFLKSCQDRTGKFIERGQVFHSDMQSGTGSGDGLTVYVLISMLEASQALGETGSLSFKNQIDLALNYIRRNQDPEKLKQEKQIYLAAITAYSLSLVSNKDKDILQLIEQLLVVIKELQVPWSKVDAQDIKTLQSKQAAGDVGPPYIVKAQATRDLEIGAYVLLTLTRIENLAEGLELMKWLQSQQNSKGGFYSTQDTIMVLQALSEFGSKFRPGEVSSQLQVTHPVNLAFTLSGSRALLLQTATLPWDTTKVNVTLTGGTNSLAVVKVVYTYYTFAGDDDQVPTETLLFLETKSIRLGNGMHKVEACVKSSKSLKYKGMFVTTMALPSGEKPADDQSTILASNPMASRVEADEKFIHFYIDKAPSNEGYCLTANVEPHLEFEVQKPGFAQFYTYYDPDNVAEVPLSLTCHNCDTDTAVMVNMASVLLTTVVCLLASLLACM
ncbi:CD109 antigen-like isoform X2 [Biomphalaria glabrata]|uniref:CD109 antigen-like isoform X2 n=1 Tax=Biomphalaria glabrata TaxID=6526 RepID=A0A9W3AU63_BIOGL|nr:CD109 antigen-like isoform X2 [Biomphalaria glabrata]